MNTLSITNWAANQYAAEKLKSELGMTDKSNQKYVVRNNEVYERRFIHRFRLSDVEDPEIYCAQPLYDWQQTEKGKWVMKHGVDPTFSIFSDPLNYGYSVNISAHITPKRWTEYVLRGWDQVDN